MMYFNLGDWEYINVCVSWGGGIQFCLYCVYLAGFGDG